MSEDYPNAIVLQLEEALMVQDDIELVSYTKFYDRFLDTDLLQKTWPILESCLSKRGVLCTLDLVEGNMKVSKTKRAEDEDIIFKAIDILQLLSRSVPARWEQFLARRKLLAGYVLKVLFELTDCGIFLKGNTIVVIGGSLQGINIVRRIVEDCIAHDVPPLPQARLMKKKTQKKKDEINKVASELMINLEGMRI